jgi:hypothetical protein
VGVGPRARPARLLPAFLTVIALWCVSVTSVVQPAAAAPRRAVIAACTNNVAFQLIQATTAGCLNEVSPGQWETTDPVTLNGIALTPAPGTKLVLVAPTPAAPGGQLSVDTSINVAGISFERQGLLRWNLPTGNKGEEKTVVSTGAGNGENLYGFPLTGSAEIRIGWDATNDLHYFKFIANLQLPSIFKNGPEQGAGGLTATVGLRVDTAGVHADTVKAEVSNAYIGSLQVKNLCLSYLGAGSTTAPCSPPKLGATQFLECQNPGNVSRWDGSAEIVIPTADRPVVGVYAGLQNGQFSYAGGQVSHLGNAVPIAAGVYLDHVALSVCVSPPPIVFKGGAGINIGPSTNGVAPVTLGGSVQYTDSRPWELEVRGNLDVFGNQVADGFFRYRSDYTIDFGFNVNLDFKIASVEGHLLGWIEARTPLRFNVDGSGKVCVLVVACLSGEVTASSDGLAGCFTIMEGDIWTLEKDADWAWWAPFRLHWVLHHWRVRGGAGVRWGGGINVMGDECDVGPYRAIRSARAAAAGVDTVQVAAGQTALVLRAQGTTQPPRLELVSPDGATYRPPDAAAKIVPNHDMWVENPETHATQVLIAHPAAGTWTVRALDGSAFTGVEEASVDPMPEIQAAVGHHGEHRVLGYSYQPQPAHTTRFVEEGGKYEQELGEAAGRPCKQVRDIHPDPAVCGEIHFTPAPGPAGVRHIFAVTTMNGEITRRQEVATYEAPPEPEPSEVPMVSVRRLGDELEISWRLSHASIAPARPIDYNVDIDTMDGRRMVDVMPRHDDRVFVHDVPKSDGAQVLVSPVREDETQGRTRVVTLEPGAEVAISRGR